MNRKCILVSCFALLFALFTPKASADEWNKTTRVTFNAPVEIPGKVLLPGTYVIKALPETNGNVVQIWNADQTHLYATLLTVPDYRLQPADQPVLMFEPTSPDSPPALKAWFYPGEQFGRAFVYPKSRATELAKSTNQTVPAMPDQAASNLNQPVKSAADAPAAALMVVVVTAIKPSGEEVDRNQAIQSHR